MDIFLQPVPAQPPQPSSKKKKKKTTKKVPQPVDTGVGQYHAAFSPMPPEINEPQATEDPFGATAFAPCTEEDWWGEEELEEAQVVIEEEEQREDDADASWGAYDSTDTVLSDDDISVCSSPPTNSGDDAFHSFMSKRRKALREQRAVYTGPQLDFEDEEEDESCV